jgi:hypothetical protein
MLQTSPYRDLEPIELVSLPEKNSDENQDVNFCPHRRQNCAKLGCGAPHAEHVRCDDRKAARRFDATVATTNISATATITTNVSNSIVRLALHLGGRGSRRAEARSTRPGSAGASPSRISQMPLPASFRRTTSIASHLHVHNAIITAR